MPTIGEIRMSAADGSFVSKNNLTVYCSHHHGKYAKHEKCEAHTYQQMKGQSVKVADALSGDATYRVYALPAESPNHGAYSVVTPHFLKYHLMAGMTPMALMVLNLPSQEVIMPMHIQIK